MSEPEREGPRRDVKATRLVERAVRERWPIPKALRRPLIERLGEIALDPEASPREATSAAKTILAASRINLESLAVALKAGEAERQATRAAEIEAIVGRLLGD